MTVPSSKSLMARALVTAALAGEPTTLHRPLAAADALLMADALRAVGAAVTTGDEKWHVVPGRAGRDADVWCGLSGTVMRFVPPVAALGTVTVSFDGTPRARQRPMGGLLDGLAALGVQVSPAGARSLPFAIGGSGAVRGGSVTVDAADSSQFVSGLLLAGCRFTDGLALQSLGTPPSAPHVAMTLRWLTGRGVPARRRGPTSWTVPPCLPRGGDVTIEPDLSNAAPFLAAALATGGRVRVPGWPVDSMQPADELLALLTGFGGSVDRQPDAVVVTGPSSLRGLGTVDLRDVGELTPTVCALAALAETATTVTGIGHLRGHETDRIASLVAAVRAMGGAADPTPDGLHIDPAPLHAAVVPSDGDHRIATFAAVVGLRVPGTVVDDVSVTGKTMPDFVRTWQAMLG